MESIIITFITAAQIHWLGLDFTKARMIDDEGFTDSFAIVEQHVAYTWNDLVFDEYEKYNIKKFLSGKHIEQHPDFMTPYNNGISPDDLVINENYQLNEQDIKEAVAKYKGMEPDEFYMVLIVESFNSSEEEGSIWVTFFNGNKEVLYTKEMIAKPKGSEFTNYWARTIYYALKDFEKVYRKMD